MKLIWTIAILLLLSTPIWAQETPVQSMAATRPAQPSFTDQIYLIARAQEKQIEILQQELDKKQAEIDTLKKNAAPTK